MAPPIHFPRQTVVDPVRDGAHRQRLVEQLQGLGANTFRRGAIQRWSAGVDPVLRAQASRMVVARIEWNTAEASPPGGDGRPAFLAVQLKWDGYKEFVPGNQVRFGSLPGQVQELPLLLDGPHSNGIGRVTVVFFLVDADRQGLDVHVRPEVQWTRPDGTPCAIGVKPKRKSFLRAEGLRVLPPFKVTVS